MFQSDRAKFITSSQEVDDRGHSVKLVQGEGDVRNDGMHCPCGSEHFRLDDRGRPGVLTIGSRGEVTSWTGSLVCDRCDAVYELAERPRLTVADEA